MAASYIGDGTTVSFGTSSFSAYVDSARWSGQGREMIDISHIATTGGIPFDKSEMYDPGTLQLDLHHDPDIAPPIEGEFETVTVTFPSGATFSASGAVQSYDFSVAKQEKITASMTIKLSGDVTFTPAA